MRRDPVRLGLLSTPDAPSTALGTIMTTRVMAVAMTESQLGRATSSLPDKEKNMRTTSVGWFRFGAVIAMSLFAIACVAATGVGEHSESAGEHERGAGEHAESSEGEGEGEGEGREGEESGVYIGADETWDAVRRGARLILKFDADADAFVGTVTNTTSAPLCGVRVEVHLRNGPELGPTPPANLQPGEAADLNLPTRGETFTSWTAHPEMDPC